MFGSAFHVPDEMLISQSNDQKAKEYRQLISEKNKLKQQMSELELARADAIKRGENEKHQSLGRRKLAVQNQLSELNKRAKIVAIDYNQKILDEIARMQKTDQVERRRGMVDEFDLANKLIEPQDLLRQAHAAMNRITARCGRTDKDRAVIDAIGDYLRRQGIQL